MADSGATSSSITLPPGLYLRTAGHFNSCFMLEPDGAFWLRWQDDEQGTWLQGGGRAMEILETVVDRALHYEIRLHGNFACAVPSSSGDTADDELPKGFEAGAAKKAKKVKKGKAKKTKKASSRGASSSRASPKKGAPEKQPPSADADRKASTSDDSAAAKAYTIVEVEDAGPYVINESIVCPESAGQSLEEMRAWIAQAAGEALQSEYGAQMVEEMRAAAGFPFNHGVEVEWEAKDEPAIDPDEAMAA